MLQILFFFVSVDTCARALEKTHYLKNNSSLQPSKTTKKKMLETRTYFFCILSLMPFSVQLLSLNVKCTWYLLCLYLKMLNSLAFLRWEKKYDEQKTLMLISLAKFLLFFCNYIFFIFFNLCVSHCEGVNVYIDSRKS